MGYARGQMTLHFDPDRLASLSDHHVGALREAFVRAGFDDACIAAAEQVGPRTFDVLRRPLVLRALSRQDTDASAFAALFAYGGAVPRERLQASLGADTLAALQDAALLDGDATITSRVRVMPFRGVWIASTEFDAGADAVMGPGITTDELAHTLAYDGVASLADIGCGAGTLALLAAKAGVPEVVGVDIDPRAIAFAHFNARLNQLRCSWAVGDLTAPLQGRRFDAIVSQPAYVAQPGDVENVTFLHGGRRGDELAARLLAQAPGLLAPGGRLWALFDTPEPTLAGVVAWIERAFAGAPLQACALALPGNGADVQSMAYATLRDDSLGERYRAELVRYRDHFERLGIARVRHVLLHARVDPSVRSLLALELGALTAFDAAGIGRLLDAASAAALSDDALLARVVRPHPACCIVHEQSLAPSGVDRFTLHFEHGAGSDRELSEVAVLLLTALRDHEPLAAAIAAHAEAAGVDDDQVTAPALAFVREGLRSGMFVLEGPG